VGRKKKKRGGEVLKLGPSGRRTHHRRGLCRESTGGKKIFCFPKKKKKGEGMGRSAGQRAKNSADASREGKGKTWERKTAGTHEKNRGKRGILASLG